MKTASDVLIMWLEKTKLTWDTTIAGLTAHRIMRYLHDIGIGHSAKFKWVLITNSGSMDLMGKS